MSLEAVLARLDWRDGDDAVSLAAEVERAIHVLTALFDGLAVVRGGRVQLVAKRDPTGLRLLVADTATAGDHAAMLAGLRRSDHTLTTAAELLALALALPRTPPVLLGERLRRIIALGATLA